MEKVKICFYLSLSALFIWFLNQYYYRFWDFRFSRGILLIKKYKNYFSECFFCIFVLVQEKKNVMELVAYINDLLYRYDCVIVPDFGGFITREVPAKIDRETASFYPPSKELSFNSQLIKNDGLLANYIASAKQISYLKALQLIQVEVLNWKKTLESQELELSAIGVLVKKRQSIIFEPSSTVNYLTSSYGLSVYTSKPIEQVSVVPLISSEEEEEKKNKKRIPAFIRYAATAAILLALGGAVGYKAYQNQENQIAEMQQKAVEKTIQEATFVIKNPIPAITLNVTKETHPYHVIAGAFRNPKNAEKKVAQLKRRGYNATILGKNKWGLTQVSYASFDDKRKATNKLYQIQRRSNPTAWLLIEDL